MEQHKELQQSQYYMLAGLYLIQGPDLMYLKYIKEKQHKVILIFEAK